MERDIVQFVAFNDYKDNPLELAQETLEEIPKQLVSYMVSKNILPKRELLTNPKNFSFFEAQRIEFTKLWIGLGFTDEKIQEMLSKGLPEFSADLFKIHAFNPYFRNTLVQAPPKPESCTSNENFVLDGKSAG